MITTHYYPPIDLPMITLTVKDGKLLALDWYNNKTAQIFDKLNQHAVFIKQAELKDADKNQSIALQVITQLDEYFNGERMVFELPLDLSHGTDFQIKVWQTLCQIPYGQTISYKELATMINKPTAHRACANANGKNLISLIVPCHRVIASDGTLGGYTGGVDIKEKLLALEQGYLT
ncbi:methylated-DNA--[protein]-cysteine S-methyltransferase [Moraxella nonliquefaciens]|uniref:methylated-DNA--[protein]-cysteine S-methyltransferase n=1 Tax=Moraxella nonliquefaciens TaxID=478 RepID=UPI0024AE4EF6|nr:methylated-DNA--[protein]-cysteine S-methyltransferase [Moraxella nonliquefaciens]MDI4497684.1 methylated-DNA--[protein]-cysteine S-methyltransferase [Moraxella nonliquefaciens]